MKNNVSFLYFRRMDKYEGRVGDYGGKGEAVKF